MNLLYLHMSIIRMMVEDKLSVPIGEMMREVKSCVDAGGDAVLAVRGGSMMPFLCPGRDAVRLSRRGAYRPMDVVLAYVADSDRWVLHRLIRTDGVHAMLMGDGNCRMRERVPVKDIVAVVTAVRRDGGDFVADGACRRVMARVWCSLLILRPLLLKLVK